MIWTIIYEYNRKRYTIETDDTKEAEFEMSRLQEAGIKFRAAYRSSNRKKGP